VERRVGTRGNINIILQILDILLNKESTLVHPLDGNNNIKIESVQRLRALAIVCIVLLHRILAHIKYLLT
jgi:hypothetical protein